MCLPQLNAGLLISMNARACMSGFSKPRQMPSARSGRKFASQAVPPTQSHWRGSKPSWSMVAASIWIRLCFIPTRPSQSICSDRSCFCVRFRGSKPCPSKSRNSVQQMRSKHRVICFATTARWPCQVSAARFGIPSAHAATVWSLCWRHPVSQPAWVTPTA